MPKRPSRFESTAEAYLALLASRGIEWLFANAGTDFAPIIEALVRGHKAGIAMPRAVPIAHETIAVAMAHGYYLVSQGGGTTGEPLPPAQASGSTAMSASAGTVFLAGQTAALTAPPTGSVTDHPAIIDLVGYGSTNTYEKNPAPGLDAGTSAARDAAVDAVGTLP